MLKSLKFSLVIMSVLGFMACEVGPKKEVQTLPDQQIEKSSSNLTVVLKDSMVVTRSIKDGNVPVKAAFRFKSGGLQQQADGSWGGTMVLDVRSWESGLVLRNQRVRDLFFEVARPGFGEIQLNFSKISAEDVKQARDSLDAVLKKIPVEIQFAGLKKTIPVLVSVKTDMEKVYVDSAGPTEISISSWGRDAAKKVMMKACNHREIKDTVDVTFNLVLQ